MATFQKNHSMLLIELNGTRNVLVMGKHKKHVVISYTDIENLHKDFRMSQNTAAAKLNITRHTFSWACKTLEYNWCQCKKNLRIDNVYQYFESKQLPSLFDQNSVFNDIPQNDENRAEPLQTSQWVSLCNDIPESAENRAFWVKQLIWSLPI